MTPQPDMPEQPDDIDGRSDELDAHRIQRITRMRQALGRSRSHAIALAVITGVLAAQLLFNLVRHLLAHGPTWRAALYGTGAFLLAAITAAAIRRALNISRELRRSLQAPTAHDPDLSTLSDGSQRWQDLDRM